MDVADVFIELSSSIEFSELSTALLVSLPIIWSLLLRPEVLMNSPVQTDR